MKRINYTKIIIMVVTMLFLLVQVTQVMSKQAFSNSQMLAAEQKTISPQEIEKPQHQRTVPHHKIKKPQQLCLIIAPITDCQIVGASGGTVGFAQLQLSWTYAASGVKPHKLLITVYRLQGTPPGTWDNIMPSDQAFEVSSPATTTTASVLIYRLFSGDYRIVFEAHYSCNRVREYTFERHI